MRNDAIRAVDNVRKHLLKAIKHMQQANRHHWLLRQMTLPESVRLLVLDGYRMPYSEGGHDVSMRCVVEDFDRKVSLTVRVKGALEKSSKEGRLVSVSEGVEVLVNGYPIQPGETIKEGDQVSIRKVENI